MNSLITNTHTSNFHNYITKLLNECNSFTFNVAFINFSGLQLLLDTFRTLEKKKIKGKILTSTYLNFTEVKALEKILEFTNIELKIYDSNKTNIGFHSKAYIFDFSDYSEVIIGSSNITASAFKSNIEWNMTNKYNKDDMRLNDIINEFNYLWEQSYFVCDEFVGEYKKFKESIVNEKKFIYKKEIKANVMQNEVLSKIKFLRDNNENKALVVAATGSGKTYLSLLDILVLKPKRILFLVHRENILKKAIDTFENSNLNKTCGLFTGNKKELNKEYIFSTIQTMTKNYESFKKDEFDYIVVDEAHHISSKSYKVVIDYFKTDFLLGLTATPNRMDNQSIYEFFDDNIACDIRLSDALKENLITPFHYYGISDISDIDYLELNINNIDDLSKALMINKRVEYIIEQMNFYSYSGKKRKVLAFCCSKKHCEYMSKEFNKLGIKSISLTSEDSVLDREKSINKLEDNEDSLEVIFTVDIFNEGIDIPSVNTVLLLRPTDSSIVFTQQLGRGLRKHKDKEFLTILDFIGNHNKAYLVALSLVGNKKIDKESVKLQVLSDFANIPNAFILMDKITKERILNQIEKENFSNIKYLKEQYFEFKLNMNNKIPKLTDYLSNDETISPLNFISESKSYIEFLLRVEKTDLFKDLCSNEYFIKVIRFIEYLLPIKRIHEFVIIKYLIIYNRCSVLDIKNVLTKYLIEIDEKTIEHSFRYLNQEFFDSAQINRYERFVEFENNELILSDSFIELIKNNRYKDLINDSISYGIVNYEKKFGIENYGLPFFKLYENYNMLNIALLCNFEKIHSSFRGSGFLKYNNEFFLFISIEKDKFSKAAKYKNDFLAKNKFTYISKPGMTQEKGDGFRLINNINEKVNLHVFVRKFVQVDKKTQKFIYLGLGDTTSYKGNKPIELEITLRNTLSDDLYEEFTKVV